MRNNPAAVAEKEEYAASLEWEKEIGDGVKPDDVLATIQWNDNSFESLKAPDGCACKLKYLNRNIHFESLEYEPSRLLSLCKFQAFTRSYFTGGDLFCKDFSIAFAILTRVAGGLAQELVFVNHFWGSMITLMESFASATSLNPIAVSERPSLCVMRSRTFILPARISSMAVAVSSGGPA